MHASRPRIAWIALAVLFSLSFCASLRSQSYLYGFVESPRASSFGSSTAWLDDVNGDGVDDFVVGGAGAGGDSVVCYSGSSGQPLYTVQAGQRAVRFGDFDGDGVIDFVAVRGTVDIRSGRDGSLLLAIQEPWQFRSYSWASSYAPAGDVDGDGVLDVLVGDPDGAAPVHSGGAVYAFSGATGQYIHRVNGTFVHEFRGGLCAPAGDVNGDGFDDFASNAGPQGCQVWVFSGFDGSILRQYPTSCARRLVGGRDLDGDGRQDLLVLDATEVRLYSGATGAPRVLATYPSNDPPRSVTPLGDLDGDSVTEVALGNPFVNTFTGRVDVVDSRTRTVRFSLNGWQPYDQFGSNVAGGGDADADGNPDLLVGNSGVILSSFNHTGAVRAYSLVELPLTTLVHEVSLSAGGTQNMTLDAGPANAGYFYWMAGTLSGTVPGIVFQGFRLPLNPGDPYFTASILQQVPMLTGGLGLLDATGRARAAFAMPAASNPSLVGITIHHAYGVYAAPFQLRLVSNPVPVTLVQ